MTIDDAGGWLLQALGFVVPSLFIYAIVRLMILGRPMLNPFKNGWASLRAAYSIAAPPAGMQSASAVIGFVTYKDTVSLLFGPEVLYLGRSILGSSSYVCIPYAAIAVTHPPRRVTILLIPFVLDGGFQVRGAEVDISLKKGQAKELIEIMGRNSIRPGGPALL